MSGRQNDSSMRWPAWVLLMLPTLLPASSMAAQRGQPIETVTADDRSGEVTIRYRDGAAVKAPKAPDQKSLSRPALAPDGRTVGWLGEYESCCQSYPIPSQLVVWRAGRVIRRLDADAMIWNWHFYDGGRRIGYADGPTHGSTRPYSYKLYDVATGRLLVNIDGHTPDPGSWAKLMMPIEAK